MDRGDVAPDLSEAGILNHVVGGAVDASLGSTINAVRDILRGAQTEDLEAVARWLQAVLDGQSADDLQQLGSMLAQDEPLWGTIPMPGDTELSDDWRSGGYPYKNLMSRKSYEREKYQLQVELLKLQAWVKDTGQRVVIVFEGRDAAGKGGTIKRFMEHLNPAVRESSRSRSPRRKSGVSGISSATCSTCRRRARSSCSTAPGTTAPASSVSWGSAPTRNTVSSCSRRPCSSRA